MSEYTPSTQLMLERGQRILQKRSNMDIDNLSLIKDADWVKQGFFIHNVNTGSGQTSVPLEEIDRRNSAVSSAYFKWVDSSPGGNLYINPKPQYTRYADTRSPCIAGNRNKVSVGSFNGNHGIGRYYSEAIDDNAQIIYMRFGVPQFNSMMTWFTGFYNTGHATAARTGRLSSQIFQAAGKGAAIVVSIFFWPILAVQAAGLFYRFFFNKPASKFYTMKPTMGAYHNAVNEIVNQIATNMGVLPNWATKKSDTKVDQAYALDQEAMAVMHRLMPDVFTSENGFIDVYMMSGRAQRVKRRMDQALQDQFDNTTTSDFTGFVQKVGQTILNQPVVKPSLWEALKRYMAGSSYDPNAKDTVVEKMPNVNEDGSEGVPPEPSGMNEIFKGELDDGTAYIGFKVDYTGPINESFSNSFTESDLAQKINSTSSTARNFSFAIAGGNIIGGNPIGDAIQGVLGAAKDFGMGVIDGLGFSGLLSLAGNAFVDIPKHWQSSMAQLPRANYTITLTSPYGNPLSQLINIYIPLAYLMAAALPLSAGKQSYTSPFLCEYYDKGRSQTRLGMIESLSITRGSGNMGFNKFDKAMSVEVSFTIADMSSIMHMPISTGLLGNPDGILDEHTSFSDYMSILGSLGLYEQIYRKPRLLRRMALQQRRLQALTSPARWAMFTHERTPVGLLDIFFKGAPRD